ncbi:transporter substrate-binding domain-containing protein [Streptomyces sp. 796.1]|uniref:transporter substrate-binding domain-containing protein n=1 Tax=Streptomyces sp. 796.1 TaxID=3163029 RepID=UPI0039C97216
MTGARMRTEGEGAPRGAARRGGRRRTVALSAAGCALAAAAGLLLPAAFDGRGDGRREGTASAARTATERTAPRAATTASCDYPEQSLRPTGEVGPAMRRLRDRPDKKLRVGVDLNSFRWGYRAPTEKDKIAGFDIDLARAIAKEVYGSEEAITFIAIPTSQRTTALATRRVDVIVRTMTITCERAEEVAFSAPYFETYQQLLIPDGTKRAEGVEDSSGVAPDASLRGKKVCVAKGTTAEEVLDSAEKGDKAWGAEKFLRPNQLDCLVRLQLGEVDAILTDGALAASQVAQDPTLKLVDEQMSEEPEYYGVAVNKEDTDLVRTVNKVLEDYRRGGERSLWMQKYQHWLQKQLPGLTGPPTVDYRD